MKFLCRFLIALAMSTFSGVNISAQETPKPTIEEICRLIEQEAVKNALPLDYFARLSWKESRFDHLALSPVGAQGIAQFMPATARLRGLEDPFDYRQAIPASASLLNDLRNEFGNLGLASAAYNAGSACVRGWLSGSRYLPFETEDYVADITGERADNFSDRKYRITNRPIKEGMAFQDACIKLPVIKTRTTPMAKITLKPWGIQIAGNFRKSVALSSHSRLRKKVPALRKYKAYVQRRKTPMARRSIYAVRIGANSRKEAERICVDLRRAGGACIVSKN